MHAQDNILICSHILDMMMPMEHAVDRSVKHGLSVCSAVMQAAHDAEQLQALALPSMHQHVMKLFRGVYFERALAERSPRMVMISLCSCAAACPAEGRTQMCAVVRTPCCHNPHPASADPDSQVQEAGHPEGQGQGKIGRIRLPVFLPLHALHPSRPVVPPPRALGVVHLDGDLDGIPPLHAPPDRIHYSILSGGHRGQPVHR